MEKGFFPVDELEFTTGSSKIDVGKAAKIATKYHCQLLEINTNKLLDQTQKGKPGEGVEPRHKT
jgi:hypothetical protein